MLFRSENGRKRNLPRMSKKRKHELSFYLNDRGRVTYNELCRKCQHGCKQKTAYEITGCDWSSDVCSSDLLFAHSRHIALPPVLVYGFGAIFGKITAIEPPKISRSISDRVDYPPIRLSCFGIISVSVRQFSPVSFLP